MANVKCVGAYLNSLYMAKYSKNLDEMKMHKLMYFSQRESLMSHNEPLFEEEFLGWKYGPVLQSVRNEYKNKGSNPPFYKVNCCLAESEKNLLSSVMDRYGNLSSWKLSSLSHAELSWRKSRRGLKAYDNGTVKLELNAMKVDAAREKSYRKKQESK